MIVEFVKASTWINETIQSHDSLFAMMLSRIFMQRKPRTRLEHSQMRATTPSKKNLLDIEGCMHLDQSACLDLHPWSPGNEKQTCLMKELHHHF